MKFKDMCDKKKLLILMKIIIIVSVFCNVCPQTSYYVLTKEQRTKEQKNFCLKKYYQ
jgi:Na+-transporting NADH:ubiquinone oxidoreductase subunit NqrC